MTKSEDKKRKSQAVESLIKKLVSDLKQATSIEARQSVLSELKSVLSSSSREVSEEVKQSVESAIVQAETKEIEQAFRAQEASHKHAEKKADQRAFEEPEPSKTKPIKPKEEPPVKNLAKPVELKKLELNPEAKKALETIKQKPAKIPLLGKDILTQEEDATFRQFFKKVSSSAKEKRKSLQARPKPSAHREPVVARPRPSAPPEEIVSIAKLSIVTPEKPPTEKLEAPIVPVVARPKPSAHREAVVARPKPSAHREAVVARPKPSAPPEEIVSVAKLSIVTPEKPPTEKLEAPIVPVVALPTSEPTPRAPIVISPSFDLPPIERKKKSFDPVIIDHSDSSKNAFQPIRVRRVSESAIRHKPKTEEPTREHVETHDSASSIITSLSPKPLEQKPTQRKHLTLDAESVLETSKEITASMKELQERPKSEKFSAAPIRPRRRSTGSEPKL